MLATFPQERGAQPPIACDSCCFFRLVELESRKLRQLCMLTGEKRPVAGMSGCCFIPGQWSQIDGILGLQKCGISGNTGDPNYTRQRNCLSKNGRKFATTKNAIVDFSAKLPIYHSKRKAERQLLYVRETARPRQLV